MGWPSVKVPACLFNPNPFKSPLTLTSAWSVQLWHLFSKTHSPVTSGLRAGDEILVLNSQSVSCLDLALIQTLFAEQTLHLRLKRAGPVPLAVASTCPARPCKHNQDVRSKHHRAKSSSGVLIMHRQTTHFDTNSKHVDPAVQCLVYLLCDNLHVVRQLGLTWSKIPNLEDQNPESATKTQNLSPRVQLSFSFTLFFFCCQLWNHHRPQFFLFEVESLKCVKSHIELLLLLFSRSSGGVTRVLPSSKALASGPVSSGQFRKKSFLSFLCGSVKSWKYKFWIH